MNPLTAEIATAQNSDNKLILIIGGPGSGKSKLIHDYSNETGIPILNLDQIFKDDCSEIITVMNDFIDNYDKEVLLLDNKRVLYAKDSNIDMLTFLKELTVLEAKELFTLAKKIIVVATWNGTIADNKLIHIRSKLPANLEYSLKNEQIKFIKC